MACRGPLGRPPLSCAAPLRCTTRSRAAPCHLHFPHQVSAGPSPLPSIKALKLSVLESPLSAAASTPSRRIASLRPYTKAPFALPVHHHTSCCPLLHFCVIQVTQHSTSAINSSSSSACLHHPAG
jgi:hypothetical protein